MTTTSSERSNLRYHPSEVFNFPPTELTPSGFLRSLLTVSASDPITVSDMKGEKKAGERKNRFEKNLAKPDGGSEVAE